MQKLKSILAIALIIALLPVQGSNLITAEAVQGQATTIDDQQSSVELITESDLQKNGTMIATKTFVSSDGSQKSTNVAFKDANGVLNLFEEEAVETLDTPNQRKTEIKTVNLLTEEETQSSQVPESNDPNITLKNIVLTKDEPTLESDIISDEYLVKFKKGTSQATINKILSKYSLKSKKSDKLSKIELVKLPMSLSSMERIDKMSSENEIEYIEANRFYYPTDIAIDEPYGNQQWGLENFGQPIIGQFGNTDVDIDISEAWTNTQGDDSLVIGVLDTGIDFSQPDLQGKCFVNIGEIPGNNIDDDNNGYVDDVNGWDFFNNDNTVFDPEQQDTHGTHVAGIIAGSDNDYGIVGVAPNVKILPMKFLGPEGGDTFGAVQAIAYAKSMGIKLINNSWGGGYSQALEDAINEATDITFVFAAGNSGLNMDINPSYPASSTSNNIISVAAVNNSGKLSEFSNYGNNTVDMAAPGEFIISTVPDFRPQNASIATVNDTYKALFQGFGVEALTSADQIDYISKVMDFFDHSQPLSILIVDDDESEGEYSWSDYAATYETLLSPYGTVDIIATDEISFTGPSVDIMSGYDLVVWETGSAVMSLNMTANITDSDQINLTQYLEQGGNLFLVGRDAGWGIELTAFYNEMLGTAFFAEKSGSQHILGIEGDSSEFSTCDYRFEDYFVDHLIAIGPDSYPLLFNDFIVTENFAYFSGTSMAAPFVTGVAALLISQDPLVTTKMIKDKLMKSTQYQSDLAGKVMTSGIVNASNALSGPIVSEPDDDIPGVELVDTAFGDLNSYSDKDDVYSIYLEKGSVVQFKMTADPGTDFDLLLYEPTTVTVSSAEGIVASSEQESSNEVITYVVPISGVYYLDVYGYAGSGFYNISYKKVSYTYDDRDPALNYTGAWTQIGSSNYYNGTASTLRSNGKVELAFEGNKVVWNGFKSKYQGIAKVTIDGNSEYVDCYDTNTLNKQVLFTKELSPGNHQLTIEYTGKWSTYAKKTSTSINIDSITVINGEAAPEAPTNLQAYPTIDGISFNFIASTDAFSYQVYTSKDGIVFEPIDCYINLYDIYGNFYIHSTDPTEKYYYIVALSEGGIESAPSNTVAAAPYIANVVYSVEDTDSSINYSGNWNVQNMVEASDNTVHVTLQAGDKAYIPFRYAYTSTINLMVGPDMGTVNVTWPFGMKITQSLYNQYIGHWGFGLSYSERNETDQFWIVECVSGKVNFDYMTIQDIDFEAPMQPIIYSGNYSNNTVELDFASLDEEVKGYNIYRSELHNELGTKLNSELCPDKFYVDSELGDKSIYYYRITAVDYSGWESEASDPISVTIPSVQQKITRYEETDAILIGTWLKNTNVNNSAQTARYSSVTGDTIHFDFVGNGIDVLGFVNAAKGIVNVSLDGAVPVPVDTYSSKNEYQKVIYSITGLAEGSHTLDLTVSGNRNPLATSNMINIDAFDVYSVLSGGGTPVEPTIELIEESNPSVIKTGTWTKNTNASNSGGVAYYSSEIGAKLSLTFEGVGITISGYTNSSKGITEVIIDNTEHYFVDTYSPTSIYQNQWFDLKDLEDGIHTVEVIVTGEKSALSSGAMINVDVFKVYSYQ